MRYNNSPHGSRDHDMFIGNFSAIINLAYVLRKLEALSKEEMCTITNNTFIRYAKY